MNEMDQILMREHHLENETLSLKAKGLFSMSIRACPLNLRYPTYPTIFVLWTIINLKRWRNLNMKIPMKKNEQPNTLNKLNRRVRRRYFAGALTVMAVSLCTVPAMAAGSDPLTIVNSLSDFIFNIIKAIGVIILGWGVVQVGMSIQSHDASQRTQGFLCLFGGLMIAFAKEILTTIGAI